MIKKYSVYIVLIAFLASCSSKKVVTKSNRTTSVKSKLESQFKKYKGVKYKYGGTDKRGFDCSGFVGKVYKDAFKKQLPRTTKTMEGIGSRVSKKSLKPGDLVFFRPSIRYRHVGIYMGNGYFIHSSTSKGVIKSKLDNVYWKKKYRFAKRVLKK